MVRKLKGKGKSAPVNHLKKNNTHVTSKKILQILKLITSPKNLLLKISLPNFERLKTNKKNKN